MRYPTGAKIVLQPDDASQGDKRQRTADAGQDLQAIAWNRLAQIMAWRDAGKLTDSEFENAKRLLGL